MPLLIVAACFVASASLLLTSQVTAGPVAIGFAILLAVFARMAQAERHQKAK